MSDTYDNSTGEIIQDPPMRAADGAIVPHAALTGGQFIDILHDGEFSQEVHVALTELAAEMQDIGNATGQKTKGKLVITVDFTREDNAFRIAAELKVTKPKLPKPRAICWVDDRNRFTRFPPNQGQFFGVRNVGNTGGVRAI